MSRILAIARLTLKSAFRFRLVLLLGLLLLGIVIILPLVIRDDGTARGFTQILLTYTLASITTLLGLATLWLACGTLARDVEECQMQVVAVKPIARWQIWLGKWLGIMLLNVLLLGLSGGAVFYLLKWKATRLAPAQRAILQNEVLVARGSAREPERDWASLVDKVIQQNAEQLSLSSLDRNLVRRQIEERAKAQFQLVPPQYGRRWEIPLGFNRQYLQGKPLYIRVKFMAAGQSEADLEMRPKSFLAFWQIGQPETPRIWRDQMNLAAGAFHEFAVPSEVLGDDGVLTIDFQNHNEETLLFPLEDGMEVLYREGSFGLNFLRGLGIVLCWLALLAALGLAAASFLSFPVASFVALAVLFVGLSTGTLSQVIEEGGVSGVNHETGIITQPMWIDQIAVQLFSGLLTIINWVRDFSPIDYLSTGRSITWSQLLRAVLQVVVGIGGLLALIGISLFSRRELATAQGNS